MPSANQSFENPPENSDEKQAIRVMAADSTRMNSQMLAEVLARDKRFFVLETQVSADAILAATERDRPDVVLLSPVLENDSARGYSLLRELRSLHSGVRVVMLLDRSERSSAVEAFRAGASGIFCRTESLKLLPRCIACVHAGQVWANSHELKYLLDALAEAVPPRPTTHERDISVLSKREQDVVRGVADGLSNREIAKQLNLTEHTVKNYLFRIFDKLGVSSRVEVVLFAFGLGSVASQDASAQDEPGNQNSTAAKAVALPGRSRKRPMADSRHSDEASKAPKPPRKSLPI